MPSGWQASSSACHVARSPRCSTRTSRTRPSWASEPANSVRGTGPATKPSRDGGLFDGAGRRSPQCRASTGSALRADAAHNSPLRFRQSSRSHSCRASADLVSSPAISASRSQPAVPELNCRSPTRMPPGIPKRLQPCQVPASDCLGMVLIALPRHRRGLRIIPVSNYSASEIIALKNHPILTI